MSPLLAIAGFCFSIPGVRAIVEDVIVRLITSGDLFASNQDPEYREKALFLMSQLGNANTPEAKRAILVQIQNLRRRPGP